MEDGLRPCKALQDLLPPLGQDDYERLKTHIALTGRIQVPLLVGEEGILDGAHRYAIAQELGIKDIPIVHSTAKGDEAIRLGLTLNLARRQLTPEQKREVIGKLRARGWTQQDVAQVVGMTRQGVGKAEDTSIAKSCIPCIPDLRLKLAPKHRQAIVEKARTGEPQAQVAADYGITQQRVSQIVRRATQRTHQGETAQPPRGISLIHGDSRKALKHLKCSVDVIFTDPPYDEASLPLYAALGQIAGQALKEGGYLITYSGQAFLPEVMGLLREHLTYYWIFCLPFEVRQNHLRLWGRTVWNAWKPILIYSKGKAGPHKWCSDMVRMPDGERSGFKDLHKWQQPVAEAVELLRAFAPEGGLVVDPFAGSGTTLIAARYLGLEAIGVEKEEGTYLIAKARIAEAA